MNKYTNTKIFTALNQKLQKGFLYKNNIKITGTVQYTNIPYVYHLTCYLFPNSKNNANVIINTTIYLNLAIINQLQQNQKPFNIDQALIQACLITNYKQINNGQKLYFKLNTHTTSDKLDEILTMYKAYGQSTLPSNQFKILPQKTNFNTDININTKWFNNTNYMFNKNCIINKATSIKMVMYKFMNDLDTNYHRELETSYLWYQDAEDDDFKTYNKVKHA